MQGQKRSFHELFLERVFDVLLHRRPDPDGKCAFLARLERGTSRLVVIEDILTSAEYRGLRKDAQQFVNDLYQVLLRREASSSDGVADWVEFSRVHGRGAAFELFRQSAEAQLKLAPVEAFEEWNIEAGSLRVTFLRNSVQLTLGRETVTQPFEVTGTNWATLRPVLDLLGLSVLSFRIEQHLASPQAAGPWE